MSQMSAPASLLGADPFRVAIVMSGKLPSLRRLAVFSRSGGWLR
jgi:hypothetical protein